MHYYSTNNRNLSVDFREATLKGQPADKGLFFPSSLPVIDKNLLKAIDSYDRTELAVALMRPYVGDALPMQVLEQIVSETISFDFPLVPVDETISSLELYHGPTLAFKDVGARFMSRCLGYFARGEERPFTVLVATSGDTGGAVADAFAGVDGVSVIILYPSGKVSKVQEQQLTTLGGNIEALEISGSFDDCQRLVKQALVDAELAERYLFTSANSINVARWLPQQLYYFFAWQRWGDKENPPVVSVPSGNFGNLCAGLLAARSGLPVKRFIAACNANDAVLSFLSGDDYIPRSAVPTLSNAMDVGAPSNFVRLLELFGHDRAALQQILTGYSIGDDTTIATIKDVYNQLHYLLDPHGAVAYASLKQYLNEHPGCDGYFLETAHPVKFYDAVEEATHSSIELPSSIKKIMHKQKKSVLLPPHFDELKEWMMNR